jgi:predicted enzyme related to lactoylglutathione lyase
MPDGRTPEPGGWNRFVLTTDNISELAATLREAGVHFINEPISGPGGQQVLISDPDGNPIELFQARAA